MPPAPCVTSSVKSALPVSGWKTWIERSPLPTASAWLSGEKASERISVVLLARVVASSKPGSRQTRTRWSSPPVANSLPSGENAAESAWSSCCSTLTVSPLAIDQTRTVRSQLAEAS